MATAQMLQIPFEEFICAIPAKMETAQKNKKSCIYAKKIVPLQRNMPIWLQKQHEQQSTNENPRQRDRHLWRIIHCWQVPQLDACAIIHVCIAAAVGLWYCYQLVRMDSTIVGCPNIRYGDRILPLCQQNRRKSQDSL